MNLRRIFANAIARRVAYVLVAVVLAWVGLGDARAQQYDSCFNASLTFAWCEYRSDAYSGLDARLQYLASSHQALGRKTRICWGAGSPDSINGTVIYGENSAPPCPAPEDVPWGNYRSWVKECPDGQSWDDSSHTCGSCSDKQPLGPGGWSNVTSADTMCRDECVWQGGSGDGVGVCFDMFVDGQRYRFCSGWSPTGATCSAGDPGFPGEPSAAPPDSDGDGTSDDFDSAPNNPGRGGSGPDGEPTQEDGDCGGVGQPECGALGSGSGNGNTSGGGGDCNTPPSSTGDPILAQIAFQTWATRCAVEGTANQGSGTGTGTGDGKSALDQLRAEAAGLDQSLGEGDASDAWIDGPSSIDLDTGGLGIGGTCPAPPTVNGQSIDPDGNLCMLVQIIGALVLVGAFAHAGYIIGRA